MIRLKKFKLSQVKIHMIKLRSLNKERGEQYYARARLPCKLCIVHAMRIVYIDTLLS